MYGRTESSVLAVGIARPGALLALLGLLGSYGYVMNSGNISVVINVGDGEAIQSNINTQFPNLMQSSSHQGKEPDQSEAENGQPTEIWRPRAEVLTFPLLVVEENRRLVEQERAVRMSN